jgi:hypothetical protein
VVLAREREKAMLGTCRRFDVPQMMLRGPKNINEKQYITN